MVTGIVKVEINIEKHIIASLILARRVLARISDEPKEERRHLLLATRRLSEAITYLRQLEYLECREPGKGKFAEVETIRPIIRDLAQLDNDIHTALLGPSFWFTSSTAIASINTAITELEQLKKMELRFG